MSFGIGDALLAALAGGAGQIGADYEKEKEQKEADERARIAAVAKESYDKRMKAYDVSLEPPKYQTYDDTQDGKAGKRTVRTHFDPTTGQQVEEQIGFAPNKPTPPTTRNVIMGQNEATQQFNPDTGQWDTIGAPGARFAPRDANGTADRVSFSDYQGMTPEQRAAYRSYKAPGSQGESTADKADIKARTETNAAVRDLAKLDKYDRTAALQSAGVDPTSPHALDTYRANTLYANQNTMGVDPFKSVAGGAVSSAPILRTPDAQTSPAQPGAPSVQDLLSQANAAIKRGAPQSAVEARLKRLMVQYGYQPQ